MEQSSGSEFYNAFGSQPGNTQTAVGWNVPFRSKRKPYIPIGQDAWLKNRDGYVLAHDSMYENPIYIKKFLQGKGKENWDWDNTKDYDGDGKKDTVIKDANKVPIFWNGYHYVDNKYMLDREAFMQDPENEKKYQYKMSKYKYDMKSDYEKLIYNFAKNSHERIVAENRNDKSTIRDLSTEFFKTFIKQVLIYQLYILKNKITSKENYVNELRKIAQGFKNDPNYNKHMAKNHKEIMRVFKLAKDYYTKLLDKNETQQNNLFQFLKDKFMPLLPDIYQNYKKLNTTFDTKGLKQEFIISFVISTKVTTA